MFANLSERLRGVLDQVRGRGRLTEDNIQEAVRDVRRALIEADVALPVVRDFVEAVRQRALGAEVLRSLSPGQAFIKILNDELTTTLGSGAAELNLRCQPPAVILLAGLQGAGKTTTAAKLALHIRDRLGRRVGVASTDTQRPAAMLQLQRLAEGLGKFMAMESLQPMGGAARTPEPWERALASLELFPLRIVSYDTSAKEEFRLEATAIEKKSLPDSLFTPPAGYQPLDMAGLMPGMMPGGLPGFKP